MSDLQRRKLWAVARNKGYADKQELTAFVAGALDRPFDEVDLSALSKRDAAFVIDYLEKVALTATRETPDGPAEDEWTLQTNDPATAGPSAATTT